MPWSPVPKFKDVLHNLKERGFIDTFSKRELENSMMLILGVSNQKTMDKIGAMMLRLGFIEEVSNNIYKEKAV